MKFYKILFALCFLALASCESCGGSDTMLEPSGDIDPTGGASGDATSGSTTGGTTGDSSGGGSTSDATTSGSSTGASSGSTTSGTSDGGTGEDSGSGSGDTGESSGSSSGSGTGGMLDHFPNTSSMKLPDGIVGQVGGTHGGNTSGGTTADDTDDDSESSEWGITPLWQGMRFAFANVEQCDEIDNDGNCINSSYGGGKGSPNGSECQENNFAIYSIGQYINQDETGGYWNNEKNEGTLQIGISTNLQNKSSQSGSATYKYRSYYTALAYNKKYMKIFSGSANLDDPSSLQVELDSSFFGNNGAIDFNNYSVAVLLNGVRFKSDSSPTNISGSLSAQISLNGYSESLIGSAPATAFKTGDSSLSIPLEIKSSFGTSSNTNYNLTADYTIFVFDTRYVHTNLNYAHDGSQSLYCSQDLCSTTLNIADTNFDDSFSIQKNRSFTGITSWGFKNGNVIDGTFKNIRGYATFKSDTDDTDDKTTPGVTIAGEAEHEDCDGFSTQDVTTMNNISPLTFYCKDDTVCKTKQSWLDWHYVSPPTYNTASDSAQPIIKMKFDD